MPRDIRKCQWDLSEAAGRLREYTRDVSFEQYAASPMLRDAVERLFITIGEAMTRLRRIDEATFSRISDAVKIVGLRNVLLHGYDIVRVETIYEIIHTDLPTLVADLESLKGEWLGGDDDPSDDAGR